MALLGPYASALGLDRRSGRPGPRCPSASPAELAAAVAAALDNVARHCPPGTKAFVLVERRSRAR